MADTKISALTELTAPVAGDYIPIVDTSAAATKKVDWGRICSALNVLNYGVETDGVTDYSTVRDCQFMTMLYMLVIIGFLHN